MILAAVALAALQAPPIPMGPDPMPPPRPRAQAPAPSRRATDLAGPDAARSRQCTDQIRTNAEAAVEAANAWRTTGGGLPARQCLGLALVALGRWQQAAAAFEQAAHDAEAAGDPRRAGFWVQAANGWLAAGEGRKAMADFDAALLTPGLTDQLRGEIYLDRGRAQVALGDLPAARAELDRAVQLAPNEAYAWYLSAALAQREHNLLRAGTDIVRARQLAPDDPDIILLAGTIAGLNGHMDEAERIYRQLVRDAPDSDAGRQAAASLATLHDVEVPAAAAAPAPARPSATPPHSR